MKFFKKKKTPSHTPSRLGKRFHFGIRLNRKNKKARTLNLQSLTFEPHAPCAVLGDIHANLEALETVLADIKEQGVSQHLCSGDVVGYASNPSECLKIIRELNCPVVMGNHDSYAATADNPGDINAYAMNAILWTRKRLSGKEKAWLGGLPMEVDLGQLSSVENSMSAAEKTLSCRLVHSSLVDPAAWHYISKPATAEVALRSQNSDIVFFGHTHLPSIFSLNPETNEFHSLFPAEEGVHPLRPGWRYLINPGSVGQPRDRDARASYELYDPEAGTIEIRRVGYDISATQKKIETTELPLRNAERLMAGK